MLATTRPIQLPASLDKPVRRFNITELVNPDPHYESPISSLSSPATKSPTTSPCPSPSYSPNINNNYNQQTATGIPAFAFTSGPPSPSPAPSSPPCDACCTCGSPSRSTNPLIPVPIHVKNNVNNSAVQDDRYDCIPIMLPSLSPMQSQHQSTQPPSQIPTITGPRTASTTGTRTAMTTATTTAMTATKQQLPPLLPTHLLSTHLLQQSLQQQQQSFVPPLGLQPHLPFFSGSSAFSSSSIKLPEFYSMNDNDNDDDKDNDHKKNNSKRTKRKFEEIPFQNKKRKLESSENATDAVRSELITEAEVIDANIVMQDGIIESSSRIRTRRASRSSSKSEEGSSDDEKKKQSEDNINNNNNDNEDFENSDHESDEGQSSQQSRQSLSQKHRFQCPSRGCLSTFTRRFTLKQHMVHMHPNAEKLYPEVFTNLLHSKAGKEWPCPFPTCDCGYVNKGGLANHLKKKHLDQVHLYPQIVKPTSLFKKEENGFYKW